MSQVEEEEDQVVDEKRDLLARHSTISVFMGLEAGRESMLRVFPPRPAKQWANFEVEEYLEYEKPGEYGDDKGTSFGFVPAELPSDSPILIALQGLQPGSRVRLDWLHEYVTRTTATGMSSSSPERPVQRL